MAPTPDRRSALLLAIAGALVAVGVGLIVFAVVDSSGPAPAPPAGGIAAALDDAGPAGDEFPGLTETELALGDDCLHLVVADDEAERGQGLRARTDLGSYDGMLFVNDQDVSAAYTMSGVTVPLDIGWYAGDGSLVDRTEMEPCPEGGPDCPLYPADGRYRFAVETLGGGLPGGALGACPS